jgi:hypothetical protein
VNNYLEFITQSTIVNGASNNLELGLHILNYYEGNVDKSLKAFLNDSINLPKNHPMQTYKYSETDPWSDEEIKLFEKSILKNDKNFSAIAKEVSLTSKLLNFVVFFFNL